MWFRRRNVRPSTEEVTKRLVVLKYMVDYAMVTPPREMMIQWFEKWDEGERAKFINEAETMRDEHQKRLRSIGLWDSLSPQERKFVTATMLTMTQHKQLNAMWRIEAAQVLMWALGLIKTLSPYDTQAGYDLLKAIPSEEINLFAKSVRLLPDAEIDQARELAELWHWRSRTRQLIEEGRTLDADPKLKAAGFKTFDDIVRFAANRCKEEGKIEVIDEDFAVRGKAYRELTFEEWSEISSITMERHFALNWLCGYAPYNQWDKTPTNT